MTRTDRPSHPVVDENAFVRIILFHFELFLYYFLLDEIKVFIQQKDRDINKIKKWRIEEIFIYDPAFQRRKHKSGVNCTNIIVLRETDISTRFNIAARPLATARNPPILHVRHVTNLTLIFD